MGIKKLTKIQTYINNKSRQFNSWIQGAPISCKVFVYFLLCPFFFNVQEPIILNQSDSYRKKRGKKTGKMKLSHSGNELPTNQTPDLQDKRATLPLKYQWWTSWLIANFNFITYRMCVTYYLGDFEHRFGGNFVSIGNTVYFLFTFESTCFFQILIIFFFYFLFFSIVRKISLSSSFERYSGSYSYLAQCQNTTILLKFKCTCSKLQLRDSTKNVKYQLPY